MLRLFYYEILFLSQEKAALYIGVNPVKTQQLSYTSHHIIFKWRLLLYSFNILCQQQHFRNVIRNYKIKLLFSSNIVLCIYFTASTYTNFLGKYFVTTFINSSHKILSSRKNVNLVQKHVQDRFFKEKKALPHRNDSRLQRVMKRST